MYQKLVWTDSVLLVRKMGENEEKKKKEQRPIANLSFIF